jgi:hypothetical protein
MATCGSMTAADTNRGMKKLSMGRRVSVVGLRESGILGNAVFED